MTENEKKSIKGNAARPPSFWRRFGMQFGIWSVGIIIWLVFVFSASEAFTSVDIYLAFASTTPIFALMAIPLTLIVITGEIDLSFPSIMALATAAFAKTFSGTGSIWLGFVVALTVGVLCGYFNGYLITKFQSVTSLSTLPRPLDALQIVDSTHLENHHGSFLYQLPGGCEPALT